MHHERSIIVTATLIAVAIAAYCGTVGSLVLALCRAAARGDR